jgi:hypothetical protein
MDCAHPPALKMKTILFGTRSGPLLRLEINLKTVTDPVPEKQCFYF